MATSVTVYSFRSSSQLFSILVSNIKVERLVCSSFFCKTVYVLGIQGQLIGDQPKQASGRQGQVITDRPRIW